MMGGLGSPKLYSLGNITYCFRKTSKCYFAVRECELCWTHPRREKLHASRTYSILDELGYLPIDKTGADLLFQVISLRYEQGAIIITSNRAFKEWPTIFNHDSTLTSAVLDRLLHHADTIIIEGKSFRMKDQIES
jgi:hypothetical protein